MNHSAVLPTGHPAMPAPKVGVLLVNLGSPDAPTPAAVRRYLAQFLSDRRVIELSPVLWQPILRGIILNVRPRRSAAKYAEVWDHERGGSPLTLITADQAAALAERLGPDVVVDWAMRYGNPSIDSRLQAMMAAGCTRIVLAPLYPQYSGATTATAVDAAAMTLARLRWQPALRTLPPYHDDPAYIDALERSARASLAELGWQPERVLLSFHGMPRETLDKGDPYHCQCQKTARLLRERMGWTAQDAPLTFQSRFGPKEWLKPYAEPALIDMAKGGVRRVAVMCPGFAADCLETLEEVQLGFADVFKAHGGENFAYLPCLNASAPGIDMLQILIRRELSGWIAPTLS